MIKLENVHKKLGNRPILKGVTLQINKGETMMLVGPSGTGKSVTLSHIIGLMKPDSGNVIVRGQNVAKLNASGLEELRTHVGMLFQGGALLNWMNLYDNIALPLRERTTLTEDEIRERIMTVLDVLSLKGSEEKMPSEISGGMVKRAGLARAVVCNPEVMLYDEPTSGLDPVMSRKIDQLIKHLQDLLGMTSVVVTHDLISALNVGDRIAMIAEGRIIEVNTPDTFLKSTNPMVRNFIDAQFTLHGRRFSL